MVHHFHLVIPTKDRADTLYWTLKTCLDQNYENYSIWISDDSTDHETKKIVSDFNEKKIHYFHTPQPLSLAGNLEYAIQQIEEEGYIIFIGDDDAVISNGFFQLNNLLNNYPVLAVGWKQHKYFWNSHPKTELRNNGLIQLDQNIELLDSKKSMLQVSRTLDYTKLPCIYHGAMHSSIIKRAREKSKTFIHCISPDVYTGIIACCETKKFIYSHYPFTISGHSQKSTGVSSNQSTQQQKEIWNRYIASSIPFHPSLSPSPGTAVVVTDAFLKAKSFYPEVPVVNLKTTIQLAYSTCFSSLSRDNVNATLKALNEIASKNDLMPYFNQLLIKYPAKDFRYDEESHYSRPRFDEENNQLFLDLNSTGINDIYLFSQFLKSFQNDNLVFCRVHPVNITMRKYLFRLIWSIFFKLKRKVKKFF